VRVLVSGGAGYIGSVVTELLLARGDSVVVADSLITGHRASIQPEVQFVHLDIRDGARLEALLRDEGIEAVVHMAAISLVGDSVREPGLYYQNNVVGTLSLLEALRRVGVRKLVFSSTAAVYGEPVRVPIQEEDPTLPTSPYGSTKLAMEQAMHWYDQAYGLRYTALRYFNAAGATVLHGEDHRPETHLIPRVLQAILHGHPLTIFGDDYPTRDGTGVRDYVHVLDLADAHLRALDALDRGSAVYNLGCGGEGFTVREVLDAARTVTGKAIPLTVGPRRAGDPAVLVASSDKIRRELGWKPRHESLEAMVGSAWSWMLAHPHGYGTES
jgi:UDP-glucose 4-epimerase